MTRSNFKGKKRLADLEATLNTAGLGEHLKFAREMAAKGVPADELEAMMRGNFSRATIDALIIEATVQRR